MCGKARSGVAKVKAFGADRRQLAASLSPAKNGASNVAAVSASVPPDRTPWDRACGNASGT
jgi:hypothetical protein